jgi:hypothetical protein
MADSYNLLLDPEKKLLLNSKSAEVVELSSVLRLLASTKRRPIFQVHCPMHIKIENGGIIEIFC